MYQAIVAKIDNVFPIEVAPGVPANNIQRALILGYTVVVGKATQPGDLGVFFPTDGQLSEEFCQKNDLISRTDESGKKAGGYFDHKRRVRVQKFKGIKSDGFYVPLDYFDYTGARKNLVEGLKFDVLNGKPICNKYYTERTLSAKRKEVKLEKKKAKVLCFAEHMDTDNLRYYINSIKPGSLIYVTYKLHGTSGRTGYVPVVRPLPWWKRAINTLRPHTYEDKKYEYVTGTRRTVLAGDRDGFYGESFRKIIEKKYFEGKLRRGEVLYYEIVGYTESGKPIMGTHDLNNKQSGVLDKKDVKHLVDTYGSHMEYSYGCEQLKDDQGNVTGGTCEIYVYRITMVNEDGHAVDLSWPQVKARCAELNIKHVPELPIRHVMAKVDRDNVEMGVEFKASGIFYDGNKQRLEGMLNDHLEKPSILDPRHLEEGVCVRIENGYHINVYKHKSWFFHALEGIAKDKPEYLDTEEAS